MPDFKQIHAVVTGANGFLGRPLAKYLQQAGARVTGFDPRDPSPDSPRGMEYRQVDILDFDQLYHALSQFRGDELAVFHLAGQSHVGRSRMEPLPTWTANVTGTAHVLEACRSLEIQRVIFPSSALVYTRPSSRPLVETDSTLAYSVYESSKLAAETLIQGYSMDFGLACRIARLGNVYGPGAASDSVIQILLRQVQNGGPIVLRTLGVQRDFVYRDDVVSGLAALALHAEHPGCEIYNLSSGVLSSVREVAEIACRVGGRNPSATETQPLPPGVIDQVHLSIQRLKDETGWYPAWTLEAGLRQTLAELGSEAA